MLMFRQIAIKLLDHGKILAHPFFEYVFGLYDYWNMYFCCVSWNMFFGCTFLGTCTFFLKAE